MKQNIHANAQKPLQQLAKELIVDMIRKNGYKRNEKLPTERELALHSGVSRATIARAYAELTDKGMLYHRVGKGTFVLNTTIAADQMPHRVIALFVPNLLNPVFALFSSEFEEEAFKYGYSVILCQSEKGLKKIKETYVRHFKETAVDAIAIVAGSEDVLKIIKTTQIPHVFINATQDDQDLARNDVLLIKTRSAVAMATEHLLSLGHRKIALLGGTEEMNRGINALGYRDALKSYQLTVDQNLLIYEDSMPGYSEMGMALNYRLIGEWLLKKLLSLKERPTATVVFNDARAIGIIDVAKKQGIKIPEDLAIVGIDNDYASSSPAIALTSVDLRYQNLAKMAALALKSTIENIPFDRHEIEKLTTPKLIIRHSSEIKRK